MIFFGIFIGIIIGVSFSKEIIEWLTDEKIENLYKDSKNQNDTE